ncbi:MAG: hypothetical protein CVU34_15365 [Betaproteobacteria bacterium HGW-Betaproteobacteria-7]|jgi:hypothetical protein|nr:MAG: hypothetical protein CVU34_15365 [Betaproteobacteria bacterium HGW-Betaproteobacteria-7]
MKKTLAAIVAACTMAFSSGAFAVSTANGVSFSCAGGDFTSLSGDGFTASCGGDFEVSGGTLFSDAWIRLTAGGALRVDDVSLVAPSIDLTGDGVTIGSASFIDVIWSRFAIGDGLLVIGRGDSILLEGRSGANVEIVGGGDLSLGGGTVLTDGDYAAGGRITLVSGSGIINQVIGGDVWLAGGAVKTASDASPGGNLIVISQVPEAPVHLMWLLGVGVLAGLGRRGAARERLAVV